MANVYRSWINIYTNNKQNDDYYEQPFVSMVLKKTGSVYERSAIIWDPHCRLSISHVLTLTGSIIAQTRIMSFLRIVTGFPLVLRLRWGSSDGNITGLKTKPLGILNSGKFLPVTYSCRIMELVLCLGCGSSRHYINRQGTVDTLFLLTFPHKDALLTRIYVLITVLILKNNLSCCSLMYPDQ